MTTQEEQMLQDLTDRINNTQLSEKDPEAEQFLQKSLGQNPDTLYILAQTLLVQKYALDQAQKQLADTRAQLDQVQQQQQPKHATSFLGNLLGRNDQLAAPPPPPSAQPQFTPVPSYPTSAPTAAPQFGTPQVGAPQSGGFLRSAMQTAAGVAAGALAFEGIESLMHGFGHSAGYGSGMGGGFGGFGGTSRPEEEVINNYYGDAPPHEHADSHLSDTAFRDDPSDNRIDQDDSTPSDDFLDDPTNFDSGSNDDNSF
jgi:uncharacterized protein